MARIGIMSMQRIANYGSFLQAYGMKAMLEEMGHDVEFVDYHAGQPAVADTKRQRTSLGRKLYKLREAMGYDAPLVQRLRFILYKKGFGAKYQTILGLTPKPNYRPELDVLLVGSDEVFNCMQANPDVGYSPELFGEGHRAGRLVSYAASFGNTTLEKLERHGKTEEVGKLLRGFDAVSVRDRNSGEIVRKLSGREPEYHLDPVLAYDFMGKCRQIPEIAVKEKYLLLYAYSGRLSAEEDKWITSYARRRGWKVYAIGGVHRCADKFISCSPFEVLAYFRNAEEVITDTFHGTIFSVITHRKFATLVRKSIGDSYGNEEKLTDLLDRLNLANRMTFDVRQAAGINERSIDYAAVDEVLDHQRMKTKGYLKANL